MDAAMTHGSSPEPLIQKGFLPASSAAGARPHHFHRSRAAAGRAASGNKAQPASKDAPSGPETASKADESSLEQSPLTMTVDPWDDSEVAHPVGQDAAGAPTVLPGQGESDAAPQRSWADMAGSWRAREGSQQPFDGLPQGRENVGVAPSSPAAARKGQRRGGLSLFLAGMGRC